MAPSTALFNTGPNLVQVRFNRGTWVSVNGTPPPWFTPQRGFPAPAWDPGGPSAGNLGPGTNMVELQTGGAMLPAVALDLPNDAPASVQTYLIWSFDPKTLSTALGVMVLDGGQAIGWCMVTSGMAPP